jgi:pyruvate kinase
VARGDLGAELPIEDVPLLQVRSHYMYSFRCTKSFLTVSSKG